jgi:hypothetical protein
MHQPASVLGDLHMKAVLLACVNVAVYYQQSQTRGTITAHLHSNALHGGSKLCEFLLSAPPATCELTLAAQPAQRRIGSAGRARPQHHYIIVCNAMSILHDEMCRIFTSAPVHYLAIWQ